LTGQRNIELQELEESQTQMLEDQEHTIVNEREESEKMVSEYKETIDSLKLDLEYQVIELECKIKESNQQLMEIERLKSQIAPSSALIEGL
jgi:hypothetical protein